MSDGIVKGAEIVIAIATAITAVVAIYISIDQTALTREHNRQSVRPALEFSTQHFPSKADFKISLRNNGIGPAVIQDMAYFLENKKQPNAHLTLQSIFSFGDKAADVMAIAEGIHITLTPGTFVPPNTEYDIMRFQLKPQLARSDADTEAEYRVLRQAIANKIEAAKYNLCVFVTYCSTYDEAFTAYAGQPQCQDIEYAPLLTCEHTPQPLNLDSQ